MPALKTSSASQIGSFLECQEYWYLAHVLKLEVEQSKYAAAGDEAHKALENYSLHGTEPSHPSSKIAIQWLAPPKTPGVFIESWLQDPPLLVAGVHLRGRMDYFDSRDPALPVVKDLKSKKRWDSFMKTKRTLLKDVQMSVYVKWALTKYPKAEAASAAHVYLLREDPESLEPFVPDAKLVEVTFPREKVDENLTERIIPTLERMKEVAAGTAKPTRSPAKCNRWYGANCPFIERCWPDAEAHLDYFFAQATTGEDDMGLLDTLKASPGAASVPDPAEFVGKAPTATPPPTAPEAPTSTDGALLRKLKGM